MREGFCVTRVIEESGVRSVKLKSTAHSYWDFKIYSCVILAGEKPFPPRSFIRLRHVIDRFLNK